MIVGAWAKGSYDSVTGSDTSDPIAILEVVLTDVVVDGAHNHGDGR